VDAKSGSPLSDWLLVGFAGELFAHPKLTRQRFEAFALF
jgi:hypothetical protein